ncbi:hypothetical protein CIG75_19270 [Tumebacillus algifaecis]|uniref:Uncharacterized protein n=1 Tax=Tumebacillus algifaecis TaxID=1214604 RepID=A0A223D5P5_9BACL|nr:hypothetical protein [Tumebacillus algifaecis]ASS76875.1 hypothetical protein CIG75_19270 [Tumebacillus algifaecis]
MELKIGCRIILQRLSQLATEGGLRLARLNKDEVAILLGLPEKNTYMFVDFLEGEGYVKLFKVLGVHYASITLTSRGLNLVSSPSEFNREFQPPQNFLNITGNNSFSAFSMTGNVSVANSFNQTKSELREDRSLGDNEKIQIEEMINAAIKDISEKKEITPETSESITTTLSGSGKKFTARAIKYLLDAAVEAVTN